MKIIKSVFDFYISSSIHVGIEVSCFVLITCYGFDVEVDRNFLAFVFFGTITGYNFIKYAGIAQLHHLSLTKNLKLIQVFSFFCFLALLYFAWHLPFKTLGITAFFGVFTIFYAVPLPGMKNLRSFHGIKIFVITLVVAGLTVIVPLIHHKITIDVDAIITFFQRMAFIIAVVLPFEIRDLKFDKSELGTIPQIMGVQNTKFLGMGLLLFFFALEWVKIQSDEITILASGLITLISAVFLWGSTTNQHKYYASFWIEALPIMWFGILLLLRGLF